MTGDLLIRSIASARSLHPRWAMNHRMHFIVGLFRTRQQNPFLYDQPFTFLQLDVFQEGRVPHERP